MSDKSFHASMFIESEEKASLPLSLRAAWRRSRTRIACPTGAQVIIMIIIIIIAMIIILIIIIIITLIPV